MPSDAAPDPIRAAAPWPTIYVFLVSSIYRSAQWQVTSIGKLFSLSFAFSAAPPPYSLYVTGKPVKLAWTLIQDQIFDLVLSDSSLAFGHWKYAPGTMPRHGGMCEGEQGERYDAGWGETEMDCHVSSTAIAKSSGKRGEAAEEGSFMPG